MLSDAPCRPTIAVSDMDRAKKFYGDTLGLKLLDEGPGSARFECGEHSVLDIYPSQFAGTAKNTVAGWQVNDLNAAMVELRARGVRFEEYDLPGLKTDEGIAASDGGRSAWFKDPDGNTFALAEEPPPEG